MEPSVEPGPGVDPQRTLLASDEQEAGIEPQREEIPAELSEAEQIPPRDAVGTLSLTPMALPSVKRRPVRTPRVGCPTQQT